MDKVCFKTQGSKPCHALIEPLWSSAEHTVEKDDCGDGKRYIEHSLYEKRELSMYLLFEPHACAERHKEHYPHHPDTLPVKAFLLSYHLTHINAEEEYRHSTPEYLYMPYCPIERVCTTLPLSVQANDKLDADESVPYRVAQRCIASSWLGYTKK